MSEQSPEPNNEYPMLPVVQMCLLSLTFIATWLIANAAGPAAAFAVAIPVILFVVLMGWFI